MAGKGKKVGVHGTDAETGRGKDSPKTGRTCPVTLEQFRGKAPRGLTVTIDGKPMTADIKEFSTGSFGWFLNGKTVVDVDGVPTTVQIGMNITVVGSKELANGTE